jgi:sortase A
VTSSSHRVPVAHGTLPRTASRAALLPTERTAAATPPVDDRALPMPEDVPDPSVRLPITVIGRIQIPAIGLDAELRDQITQESIDLGPSHWPGTAAPGGEGNTVIAGHRNSHSSPFHDLGNLRPGDTIILLDAGGRAFTYSVTETFVVHPDAVWITEQPPGHMITLFTCHPIGSAAQRLVVRGTLV